MLDYTLLKEVQAGFNKQAFVPGDPTAAGGAPMGGGAGAPPVDPATGMPIDPATGMPIDPATGQPIDPSMMAGGGMPPGGAPAPAPGGMGLPPMDPATAMPAEPSADPAAAPQGATITCSLDDLAKFMQKVLAIKNGGGIEQAPAQNNDMAEIRQALTQIAARMGDNPQVLV